MMLRAAIAACVVLASTVFAQTTQPARVQGTSPQEIDKSLQQLRSTLTPEQADKFDRAIFAIITKHSLDVAKRISSEVSGKSADELIAIGERYMQDAEVRAVSTQSSEDAKQSAIRSKLQSLRAQIELYKLQHLDKPPDFTKHQWKQLTEKTSEAGEPGATGKYGPYLREPPVNVLRNAAGVIVVEQTSEQLQPVSDPKVGFVYTADGRLHALDEQGKAIE